MLAENMRPNETIKVMKRTRTVVDIFIFGASCIMASHGTARGNRATGPLIKIAQHILRPESIPYTPAKNLVGFCRLTRQSNTERRIKNVMVVSSILFAIAHEVIGLTMNSMRGNHIPVKA